ncbi:hypothetical protein FA13DRAFT_1082670 [Coprinellus micaceus]|uniref:Uncharacterized protein n=1 Tax=Coprinellus micaceus TaxID=71717 RepID=A0A4Y7TT39_COPMI|nr:hypothetical protein FA13DRAFT_1082670 [Coprinellus micaceus]
MDTMLGSVELRLSSPQTIRNIELKLKGFMRTGAAKDAGSTKFLEQGYTIWDRNFGDPLLLIPRSYHRFPRSTTGSCRETGHSLFPSRFPHMLT